MRRHRFYLEEFRNNTTDITTPEFVHQIARVLKLKAGEEIVVWNGDGHDYVFGIEKVSAKDICGRVARVEKNDRESAVSVTLYCAILKRENFELVCQKATEVGVSMIVPLLTERTVKTNINNERLKKIIKEATEQSGRACIPALCDTMSFAEALEQAQTSDANYFFDTAADVISNEMRNPDAVSRKRRDPSAQGLGMTEKVNIFIGPEGGWSDAERDGAQKAGLEFRSLGSLTLRAETAAIVASYEAVNNTLRR